MTAAKTRSDDSDRSNRFERLAGCDDETLVSLADDVLADGVDLDVVQEPTPKLVMQRVREPVERRPFNLGEVLLTTAEVRLDGERGYLATPGKAEHAALAGAILDAAVAGGHPMADRIERELERAARERDRERRRAWAERRETTVEFTTMEDQE